MDKPSEHREQGSMSNDGAKTESASNGFVYEDGLPRRRGNFANGSPIPTIHIVSDSVGGTATAVARACAGQFGEQQPHIETLSKARSFKQVREYLLDRQRKQIQDGYGGRIIVFYTLVDPEIRRQVGLFVDRHGMQGVDIMSAPLEAIGAVAGIEPSLRPGMFRATDDVYFRRIAAMEFTVDHDDGRNPQDLPKADIVLLGVSRSSKTPISIYMGQEGYKVANVPLALGTEPPKEVFQCDPSRIFGLITTPEVLIGIRQRRLRASGSMAANVASSYADAEYVYRDLEEARALMRKIGCIVIRTDNRAVEESAQEILRYYEKAHPTLTSYVD